MTRTEKSSIEDPDNRKTTLLIIEDDQAICGHLAEILRLSGYTCEAVPDCATGRSSFVAGKFACTLIDLGLPDGNGLELLKEFAKSDPCVVPIILTGDASSETIIHTMRAGAFDYLTKPVNMMIVRAAVSRAVAHHAVVRERAELVKLLLEEREQLRARVEVATADIRQYASACEISNTRLRALLGLARLSSKCYSAESLGQSVFEEVTRHVPLRCLVMCDVSRRKLLALYQESTEEPIRLLRETDTGVNGYDRILAEAEPHHLVQSWVERTCEFDLRTKGLFVFPQTFWDRFVCAVGFYLDADFEPDDTDQEFLGTCATFFAFEWEQANLMLQVAHHASLGNIAVELARNFVQPLTAIQTAADIVREAVGDESNPDCQHGMEVIGENVDRLRRQTQEFRKLSLSREDSIETVKLDEYVERALEILSLAMRNRNVIIEKRLDPDCECVLLNGTALSRTILDLLLGALREVHVGGQILLNLQKLGKDHMTLDITYEAPDQKKRARVDGDFTLESHPGLQLAERTVHSCGGKFSVDLDEAHRHRVRVTLPRNAARTQISEVAW
jgi:DNA-binding response OmpR family regulator